jgi:hypothetical protein
MRVEPSGLGHVPLQGVAFDQIAPEIHDPRSSDALVGRLRLLVLGGRFLADYATMLDDWASWAEAQVSTWPSTASATEVPLDFAYEIFEQIASWDEPANEARTRT